jgi:hypothetical protein
MFCSESSGIGNKKIRSVKDCNVRRRGRRRRRRSEK